MKKLILFAVAVVAISFASCGNKNSENKPTEPEATVNQIENEVKAAGDSIVNEVDSLVDKVEALAE